MTNFQDIFFYYGCCSMLSLACLYYPWHDTAGVVWLTVGWMKFNDYPAIIGVIAIIVGIGHLKYGYDHDKKKKLERKITKWFNRTIPL